LAWPKAWEPETAKIIGMKRKAEKQWRVALRQRQTKVVFHPERIIGRFEIAKCYIAVFRPEHPRPARVWDF
jgi:hypothetical protein